MFMCFVEVRDLVDIAQAARRYKSSDDLVVWDLEAQRNS